MTAVGFDHSCYNIEMFHDPAQDAISIIEINPRMSYQFADLFERVDGMSSFECSSRWRPESRSTGHAVRGPCKVAASFGDAPLFRCPQVISVPSAVALALLRERFPARTSSCCAQRVKGCPITIRMSAASATASSIWRPSPSPSCTTTTPSFSRFSALSLRRTAPTWHARRSVLPRSSRTFLPASLPIDRNTRLSLFCSLQFVGAVAQGHSGDAPDQIQESVRLCAFFMSSMTPLVVFHP